MYMPMETKNATEQSTHIRVSASTADQLHDLKDRGESYDDVISELLDDPENFYEDEDQ